MRSGEVPAIIVDELRRLGAPEAAIDVADSELDEVKQGSNGRQW